MNGEPDPRHSQERMEERIDGFLKRLSDRRKESIRRSLERPLRIEILRTGYLVGCVLIDVILLPVAVMEILGHDLLFITLLTLIPAIYLEYRAHEMMFHLPKIGGNDPSRRSPNRTG